MELNFIIFPAPKPSYDSETLENELIWVPVLDSLSTQTEDNIINLMENNIKTQELTKRFKYYGSLGLLNKKYTNSFVNKTKPKYYIPCLLLQSSNAYSSYILIYFHGNGEDVKLSHDLLANLRNNLQIHVIAMEYPGYGIYKGNPSADKIIEDSQHVYDFLISLGFKRKNIIVFGRSIGTGVATELAIRRKIAILALMAPFTSLRAIANDIVGRFFKYFVKERFCNIENLTKIDCPTLIVHGVEDSMISLEHSIKLHDACKGPCELIIPKYMNHFQFDFYEDFTNPLKKFLESNGCNLNEENECFIDREFIFPEEIFFQPEI